MVKTGDGRSYGLPVLMPVGGLSIRYLCIAGARRASRLFWRALRMARKIALFLSRISFCPLSSLSSSVTLVAYVGSGMDDVDRLPSAADGHRGDALALAWWTRKAGGTVCGWARDIL